LGKKQNKIEKEALAAAEEGNKERWDSFRLEGAALRLLAGLMGCDEIVESYSTEAVVGLAIDYAELFLKEIDRRGRQ
jgi:hypothetical protein